MKEILKTIFPIFWLKRAFLIYNQLKIYTFDRIFFSKELLESANYYIRHEKNPFLELHIDLLAFSDPVRKGFDRWTNAKWTQEEYLFNYKHPGFIEPKMGWGISLDRKLLDPSLGFSSAPHVHRPDFFETYCNRRNVINLGKIISLRDTGEENYFHFFNDVLAKLFYLKDHGINLKEFKVIISEGLFDKHYFQFYLKNSFLSSLQWHVQRNEWIHFEEAIFCKPFTHTKKYFDNAVDLGQSNDLSNRNRRVFLTRSPKSLRFIENFEEIEPVLMKYEYETVDTSNLSMEDQITLFRQCRYLVAIHGSGITNIIFRREKPLSLLEIVHPSPYIPFHYIMLAKSYNYTYDTLLGGKGKRSGEGGFRVNPVELDLKISSLHYS